MKSWSLTGCSTLAIMVGLGTTGACAQQSAPAPNQYPPLPQVAPAVGTPATNLVKPRRVSYQNVPPVPAVPAAPNAAVPAPPAVPAVPAVPPVPGTAPAAAAAAEAAATAPTTPSAPTAPPTPAPVPPGDVPQPSALAPAGPGGGGGVLGSNRDLSLPKSEREGGGGEPTETAAAEEEKGSGQDPTKLLMNFFGNGRRRRSRSTAGSRTATPATPTACPRTGRTSASIRTTSPTSWQGNQYYLILENPLEQGDKVNFGFRIDNLFGNDWQFNHIARVRRHRRQGQPLQRL